MYYSGRGDQGTSKLFNSKERILKSALVFDVLGSLDELNSWLGLCAIEASPYKDMYKIIVQTQNNLFICQAHLAQAELAIPPNLLSKTEEQIDKIAQLIKVRKGFVLSGASRLSALLDIGRTLARKTERKAVALEKQSEYKINELVLSYLNRLSSLLYVLARLANDLANVEEKAPSYSSN